MAEYQFTDYYWTDNGQYQDHSGCNGACSPMPYGTSMRQGWGSRGRGGGVGGIVWV